MKQWDDPKFKGLLTANRWNAKTADIKKILGMRQMAVVRELTKKFEEVKCGTPDELNSYYVEAPKGEIDLVISGAEEKERAVQEPRQEQLAVQQSR